MSARGCQGDPGKVNAAEFHLLHDSQLVPQSGVGVDLNFHLPAGALRHQLGEVEGGLCGGVVLCLVLRIGQHKFRLGVQPGFFLCV